MDEARREGFAARIRSILTVNASTALVNASALVIVMGFTVMAWELLEPMPIESVRAIRVEPAGMVLDRRKDDHLTIHRRVCASRAVSARLARSWVDDAGGVANALDDWVWLDRGCHDRPPIHVYPPATLPEGAFRYRTHLEWCNSLKCRQYHMEDLDVQLVGRRPASPRQPSDTRF